MRVRRQRYRQRRMQDRAYAISAQSRHQKRGHTALGRVLEINVMQVPVPAFREWARDIGRQIVCELQARLLRSDSEKGVGP